MFELTTIPALRGWVTGQRSAGRRIGFVPTMGFLHEGHLRLVDEARRHRGGHHECLVNPLQSGPGEDLDRYPRICRATALLAAGRQVDGCSCQRQRHLSARR
jgi:pantoate--beta-alanine ligase